MKTKKWQRTWVFWRNSGQQQPDWKINVVPTRPQYKGASYWMKTTRAIQDPEGYALIGFAISGGPDTKCFEEIVRRINDIAGERKSFHVSTDFSSNFKISFRPKGPFCDVVVGFVAELIKVLGVDPYWLKDFTLGTETYYYHDHAAGSGYISYDQFFKIQKGFIDLTQAPDLTYITPLTSDPLT